MRDNKIFEEGLEAAETARLLKVNIEQNRC